MPAEIDIKGAIGSGLTPWWLVRIVIDGDHSVGEPLKDAINSSLWVNTPGVILFHDFIGRPVREGVEYLMRLGYKCRVYFTPHMVACCWRGDFQPPDYTPLPGIPWGSVRHSMDDFDFSKTI